MRTNTRELLIEKFIPPTEILEDGSKVWRNKHGELHSFNGQPARIYVYDLVSYSVPRVECRLYCKNGKVINVKYENIFVQAVQTQRINKKIKNILKKIAKKFW